MRGITIDNLFIYLFLHAWINGCIDYFMFYGGVGDTANQKKGRKKQKVILLCFVVNANPIIQ